MAAKDWDLKKTKREAKAIRAAGSEGISQQMQQMMKYWEEYRPKMHKELTNLKLLVDVAQIAGPQPTGIRECAGAEEG